MNFKALTRTAVVSAGLVLAATFAQAAETTNEHVPLAKTIGKPTTAGSHRLARRDQRRRARRSPTAS